MGGRQRGAVLGQGAGTGCGRRGAARQGADREGWKGYDATELVLAGAGRGAYADVLVDVGDADDFLAKGQLLPEAFKAACDKCAPRARRPRQGGAWGAAGRAAG